MSYLTDTYEIYEKQLADKATLIILIANTPTGDTELRGLLEEMTLLLSQIAHTEDLLVKAIPRYLYNIPGLVYHLEQGKLGDYLSGIYHEAIIGLRTGEKTINLPSISLLTLAEIYK